MIAPLFPFGRRAASGGGRRFPARLLVAVVVSVIALLGLTPGSAAAENTVVRSSPDNGGSLNMSPEAIIIVFAEELGDANTIALDCEAEPITLTGRPEVIEDTTLQIAIDTPLPAGTCTARWAVSNADGEPDGRGVITFIVENDTPVTDDTTASSEPATEVDSRFPFASYPQTL